MGLFLFGGNMEIFVSIFLFLILIIGLIGFTERLNDGRKRKNEKRH
jgi:hypothetical protein